MGGSAEIAPTLNVKLWDPVLLVVVVVRGVLPAFWNSRRTIYYFHM
jgi:hypothetical protein